MSEHQQNRQPKTKGRSIPTDAFLRQTDTGDRQQRSREVRAAHQGNANRSPVRRVRTPIQQAARPGGASPRALPDVWAAGTGTWPGRDASGPAGLPNSLPLVNAQKEGLRGSKLRPAKSSPTFIQVWGGSQGSNLSLPFSSCVASDNRLALSVAPFPHL